MIIIPSYSSLVFKFRGHVIVVVVVAALLQNQDWANDDKAKFVHKSNPGSRKDFWRWLWNSSTDLMGFFL